MSEIDMSRYAVGDQFHMIFAVSIEERAKIVHAESRFHPCLNTLLKTYGDDLEDFSIAWNDYSCPDDPGIYECVAELNHVDQDDQLIEFDIVSLRQITTRNTLHAREKRDGMSSADRKKAVEEMQGGGDNGSSSTAATTSVGGMTIKW